MTISALTAARHQDKGWYGGGVKSDSPPPITEGSAGEGLSRFLAARFLASVDGVGNPAAGYENSNQWLSTSRNDYVNTTKATDDGPDAVTGCSLLFIYYLFSQLGFAVEDIIAAAADTLGGVFRNLTGEITANPFPRFKRLVDSYFPGTTTITRGNLDNPFPLKNLRSTPGEILWHNSSTNETQIWFWDGHRVIRRATVVGDDGLPAFVGPPWTIVGQGHFNPRDNPDILWHYSSTNETQIWFMKLDTIDERKTVVGEDGQTPALVGPPWSIVGTSFIRPAALGWV
jgi:hypothetical protein